jgi:ATP-binding cassette subfamily B protein
MISNHTPFYGLSKIVLYLPRFVAYVFRHFPSAKFAVAMAAFGVILEYATLSVMLPLANVNSQIVSNTSEKIITMWSIIAGKIGLPENPRTWLWLFLLLLGARIVVAFSQTTLNTKVSKQIFAYLSAETLTRVVTREPLAEIYRRSIGYYTALAGDESFRIGQVFFNLAQMLSALMAATIGLVVLMIFSPIVFKLTLLFLLLSGLAIGLSMKQVFVWSSESALLTRETHTTFIEAFNGIRSIRSMAGESFVAERYRNFNNRYAQVLFLLDVFNHGVRSLPALILIILGLIVLFPSSDFMHDFSVVYFFTVTTMLIRVLAFLGTAVSSGGRVAIDIRAAFDLDDIINNISIDSPTPHTGKIISAVDNISITNLSCGYVDGELVLTDVSAQLVAGRCYALMGRSGSGKSTLSDVLLGLLTPMSGEMSIDNVPYHQIDLVSLRRKVVLVEQQTRIFSGSVRENITFGLAIAEDEIQIAIKVAGLEEFINSLPNGLETHLDYQGANLSGGQRQRIGLARAIVRNPDVLILDEATSALDGQTRDMILQHVRDLFQHKILLFITHDSHIMQNTDELWHIKKGKLIIETRMMPE